MRLPAEVRADRGHFFPYLPPPGRVPRRGRRLEATFVSLRQLLLAIVPEDGWQPSDSAAALVTHPSRARRPNGWAGPGTSRPASDEMRCITSAPTVGWRFGPTADRPRPPLGPGVGPGIGGRRGLRAPSQPGWVTDDLLAEGASAHAAA